MQSCHADHFNDPALLNEWLENKTEDQVKEWIERPGNSLFVLEEKGDIRATALLSVERYLSLMFVDPLYQKSGYGKALLCHVEQYALKNGLDSISLDSTSRVRSFYQKHGFVFTSEEKFWKGIRCYPMRKLLS